MFFSMAINMPEKSMKIASHSTSAYHVDGAYILLLLLVDVLDGDFFTSCDRTS